MSTTDHRVHLDAFDGPLDLLLHLIRRAEVEITDIPIAEIAEQYLEHLSASASLDIDAAGEFLVMAATLMEIKSRVLTRAAAPPEQSPREGADDGDDSDPRAELVRQLLAYKRHRDAADALAARRDEWALRYPASRAAHDKDALLEAVQERTTLDIDDLGVGDLASAYVAALMRVDLSRLGDHHVSIETDDTPIELHQADILDRVSAEPGLGLRRLFDGRRKSEVVGLFIALLELIRERRLGVEHTEQDGDVRLSPPAPDSESGDATAHENTPGTEAPGVRVEISSDQPDREPAGPRG